MSDVILSLKDVHLDNTGKEEGAITLQEAVVNIMRDSLRLEVDTKPKSNYVGDNGRGGMYEDSTVVKIRLLADIADEEYVISEIDFETE